MSAIYIFSSTLRKTLNTIRNKSEDTKSAIQKLIQYLAETKETKKLQTLLGLEGIASRMFFEHWFNSLPWKGRKPRTKIDIVNTTLDIGYTYLFNFIECMLNLYGFDLYQGVYHRCFYQRKSLVCDLVEPFRCIIDKKIKNAWNLKQMQENDFIEQKGQYFLKREKNKDYTRWIFQAILEYKEDIFLYIQQYYRCFMRQKPINHYPFFKINE